MKWNFFDKKFDSRRDFYRPDEAWAGHVFFAYDLIRNMKPQRVVELGTFSGTSYFSMCQAVKDEGLNTRLIAVDTWEGDEHAGFYDDSIYENFAATLKSSYSDLDTVLIRKLFDQALEEVKDDSVDILHIDGLHTYEAVKHDFESWLPKMSKDGVILLHDIVVKERDFGVYQLWEEFKKKYSTIEFSHSNGLGVVFLGGIPFENSEFVQNMFRREYDLEHQCDLSSFEIQKLNNLTQSREQDVLAREGEIQDKDSRIIDLQGQVSDMGEKLLEVQSSWSWKATAIFRKVFFAVSQPVRMSKKYVIYHLPVDWQKSIFALGVTILRKYPFLNLLYLGEPGGRTTLSNSKYQKWIKVHSPGNEEIREQKKSQQLFDYRPLISFIVPVYNVDEKWLRLCIESVIAQTYDNWELCIADDKSTEVHVKKVLDEYSLKDNRIKIVYREKNGHISAASNSALEIARGEFIALLDNDDEITPNALYEIIAILNTNHYIDLVYSDEDKMELNGRRVDPFFKPGWDYDLLLSMNYITHLGVYRKSIIDTIGGFREGFEGSQDYDILLRFIEKTSDEKIVHIPKILYHWRKIPGSTAERPDAKGYAYEVGRRALQEHLKRVGRGGVVKVVSPGIYRIVGG